MSKTWGGKLAIRAFGPSGLEPFEHVIGSDVQTTLYNPELGLFWFSDAERLWVLDLRTVGPDSVNPILIASHLPAFTKLYVYADAGSFQDPGQVGEDSPELWLEWNDPPYIRTGGEEPERIDDLDGTAWLSRERARPVGSASAWTEFDEKVPRMSLPAGRARCVGEGLCGAVLPFGARGWQLVVAGDQYGDYEHHFCLLFDPETKSFATPPEAKSWADATALESGSCGPFFFNERSDAYFASGEVCRVGGSCSPLGEASAEGWVVSGVGVGMQ